MPSRRTKLLVLVGLSLAAWALVIGFAWLIGQCIAGFLT